MLASKFFDDIYYNNAYYARVGGISNSEVNSLEMEMLRMISFSLFVRPEQFERYRGSVRPIVIEHANAEEEVDASACFLSPVSGSCTLTSLFRSVTLLHILVRLLLVLQL